jgi:hypothetical protein
MNILKYTLDISKKENYSIFNVLLLLTVLLIFTLEILLMKKVSYMVVYKTTLLTLAFFHILLSASGYFQNRTRVYRDTDY